VDQATDTVYVANLQGNTVSVIDGATCNAKVQTGCSQVPATVIVGNGPFALAVDEATDTVYVTNPSAASDGDTVSVINGADCNAIEHSGCSQVPATITVGVGPLGIAVNPTTNTVYVADSGTVFKGSVFGDTVSVINGANCDGSDMSGCGQSPAQVTVGQAPWGIAVDPGTNVIAVADNDSGDGPASLSVIHGATCDGADTSGCSTAAPLSVAGVGRAPNGIAFDASTNAVYTANYENASVSIVGIGDSGAQHGAPPREAVGSLPGNLAIDTSNHTAYVTNSQSGTMSMLPLTHSRIP
jgi:YVTN family beta-propeller protein